MAPLTSDICSTQAAQSNASTIFWTTRDFKTNTPMGAQISVKFICHGATPALCYVSSPPTLSPFTLNTVLLLVRLKKLQKSQLLRV